MNETSGDGFAFPAGSLTALKPKGEDLFWLAILRGAHFRWVYTLQLSGVKSSFVGFMGMLENVIDGHLASFMDGRWTIDCSHISYFMQTTPLIYVKLV